MSTHAFAHAKVKKSIFTEYRTISASYFFENLICLDFRKNPGIEPKYRKCPYQSVKELEKRGSIRYGQISKIEFFMSIKFEIFHSNGDIVNIACSLWHVQPKKDQTQCSEQHYSCGEKVFHYVELPRREILKEGKNLGMDYNEYKKRFKNGFIFKAIVYEGHVQAIRST